MSREDDSDDIRPAPRPGVPVAVRGWARDVPQVPPFRQRHLGEVANAILSEPVGWNPDRIAKVRGELVQVAAVAVAWIEALDRRVPPEPPR